MSLATISYIVYHISIICELIEPMMHFSSDRIEGQPLPKSRTVSRELRFHDGS